MTPMNKTKYLRPTPCANHQRNIMTPINKIPIPLVNQFFAHHNVNSKQTPKNILAILLANILNPHITNIAPINEDPRYPAGNVHIGIPPRYNILNTFSTDSMYIYHSSNTSFVRINLDRFDFCTSQTPHKRMRKFM